MKLTQFPHTYLMKLSVRRMLEYRVFFFMMAVRLIIELGVLYYFWRAVFANSLTDRINGFSFEEMLTYMVFSVATLTLFKNSIDVTITQKIKAGVISLDLVKPIDFQTLNFFSSIGMVAFRFVFQTVPILLFAGFIFKIEFFLNLGLCFWYLASTLLGILCMFLLDYIFGLFSFWLLNNWGIGLAKETIIYFFSGGVIPFAFFNKPLRIIAEWLPFKAIIHIPLSIGMGKFSFGMVVKSLLFQATWITILFILSRVVWRLAQRKISIQGG